jgi:transcription elongation factor Elf1
LGFQLLTNTAIGYNLEPTQHIISAVSFTCSRCNKQGSYFLKAVSYSVTCSHCGTLYDAYSEELKSRNVSINPDFKPAIELGKTGVLNNKKYLVTGILIKNERSTSYFWEEYVLFNPIHGYAYLTQYDGHWTFLESTVDAPHKIEGENAYAYEKTLFLLFAKYKTEIKGAKGRVPV